MKKDILPPKDLTLVRQKKNLYLKIFVKEKFIEELPNTLPLG
jgi:hypothetical protein